MLEAQSCTRSGETSARRRAAPAPLLLAFVLLALAACGSTDWARPAQGAGLRPAAIEPRLSPTEGRYIGARSSPAGAQLYANQIHRAQFAFGATF
jgi:hypothetical protein